MGQGVDQLELGFSLGQCLQTNTGFCLMHALVIVDTIFNEILKVDI